MPAQRSSSNTFQVEVKGRELSEVVQTALIDVIIEDEVNLPDSCELVFRDPLRSMIEEGGFELGAELVVKVVSEAATSGTTIFEGEITALEAEAEADGMRTVVRGFDLLHRLQRGTHTETYLDMTYGDIAGAIAGRHGLSMGDSGSNRVVHDAVVQWNRTDWEFLSELAARIGHEVVIVDGKLVLRKPPDTSSAPGEGETDTGDARQLVVDGNIVELRASISGGEQVRDVEVRGWDPTTKQPVEGTGSAGSSADSAAVGLGSAEAASALGGGTLVVADRPVQSAEVASDEASMLVQQLGSAVAELDAVVYGSPELRAGTAVSLAGVGAPFDGKYVLTSCRHTYQPSVGYLTSLRVSGRQNRTLLGVIGGAGSSHGGGCVGGVVPALVSDIDDPDALGRVKVTFPWLDENATSHWARIAMAGAGPERGFVVLPEVQDEVMVAFEHNDPRYPVIIGGLFNGKDKMPVTPVKDGAVVTRALVTRTGHRIELHDEEKTVTLITGDGNHSIVLDAEGQKIRIESTGDVELASQKTVTLTSPEGMSLQCDGALELKGMGVKIDAGGGDFEASGVNAKVNGSAQAELSGGAQTSITGALVKIN